MWYYKILPPIITEICRDKDSYVLSNPTSNVVGSPMKSEYQDHHSMLNIFKNLFNSFINFIFGTKSNSVHSSSKKIILKTDNNTSYVVSDISIANIFLFLYYGTEGETKREIIDCISFDIENSKRIDLKINDHVKLCDEINETIAMLSRGISCGQFRNFFFLDKNTIFEDSFDKIIKEKLNAIIIPTDPEEPKKSLKEINDIICCKTNGIFVNTIKNFPVEYPLLILSTFSYVGSWSNKFDPNNTSICDFTHNNQTSLVEMMSNVGFYQIFEKSDYRVISLEFSKCEERRFLILLPNKGIDLSDCIKDFNIKECYKNLNNNQYYKTINLKIPKFRIENEVNFRNCYDDFGLNSLMSENPNFDSMYEIDTKPGAEVFHKSIFDVNETGIGYNPSSIPPTEFENKIIFKESFICDRPFSFYIINNDTKCRQVCKGRYTGLIK